MTSKDGTRDALTKSAFSLGRASSAKAALVVFCRYGRTTAETLFPVARATS